MTGGGSRKTHRALQRYTGRSAGATYPSFRRARQAWRFVLSTCQLDDRRDRVVRIDGRLQRADEGQVPVQLAVAEAVTHHVVVRDLEAGVSGLHVRDAARGPVQQRDHLEG